MNQPCVKIGYDDKAAALKRIADMRRRKCGYAGQHRGDKEMTVYKCDQCLRFHIGHPTGTGRKARRRERILRFEAERWEGDDVA